MARKPAADTARARFAAMLAKHLADGTRPATASGEPWNYAEFAKEVPSSRVDKTRSPNSPSNWCSGRSVPEEIEPVLRALFGPSNPSGRHAEAREALRLAFLAARAEKIAHAKRDPAGAQWVAKDEDFAIDRTARPTDQRAAMDFPSIRSGRPLASRMTG